MSDPIPPKFRDFIIQRVGKWPDRGTINYDFSAMLEASADYIDMIVAKTIGENHEASVSVPDADEPNTCAEQLGEALDRSR